MKKIIYIFLIILLFGCSNKKVRSNSMKNNTVETNRQYLDDNTLDNSSILQEENNLNYFINEKPIIIQFPNSYIINTSENFCQYKIDSINIYNSNSKESQSVEIKNKNVFLFKLPENDEWLYCFVSDDIHGYICIYDISKESFYGNFEENRKSGNTYRTLLIKEYELLKKYPNIKRYGPLLEIIYNHNVIRFWDSFVGENVAQKYRYQLLDYYEGYNEILIRKQLWEGSEDYIYNLQSDDYVCEIEDTPYFNKSRDAVFSLEYGYGDPIVYLRLFTIKNGVYEKIIDESLTLDYEYSTNGFWINNDEFQIEYNEKYYDNINDELTERKVILSVNRKNPKFEFEIIKK